MSLALHLFVSQVAAASASTLACIGLLVAGQELYDYFSDDTRGNDS